MLTTNGSEMEFFCNKDVDFEKFVKTELKTFINDNNCWINSIKDKNLFIFIPIMKIFSIEQDTKVFLIKVFLKKI